jgi:carboxyl-terminal processing protease
MPQRNLTLICVALVISLVCYQQADRSRYSSMLSSVMQTVEQEYVKPVERSKLFDDAMQGMIGGLDPYSAYMPASEYKPFLQGIEQKFGGVGIIVERNPDSKRLVVMSPLFGTPAYEAGIKPGDTIMTIDGKDTEGVGMQEAVKLIQGEIGTQVTLGVLHRNEKDVVEFKLTRATIRTESVLGDKRTEGAKWDFHLQEDPRIGLLRLINFGEESAAELKAALTDKNGQYAGYKALIIDLRNNPGGTLYGAVKICDMFLDGGVIVTTKGRNGSPKDDYEAERGTVVPKDVPLVILVNHYSASASEIVSACLQDHKRAVIIGDRTWGKGSVQNVLEIDGGRTGAVRLTTSTYWRPSGVNIHREPDAKDSDTWGVSPNPGFEVKLTDEEMTKVIQARAEKDSYRPYDDPPKTDAEAETEGKQQPATEPFDDPQMHKAIEYLQQKIGKPGEKEASSSE